METSPSGSAEWRRDPSRHATQESWNFFHSSSYSVAHLPTSSPLMMQASFILFGCETKSLAWASVALPAAEPGTGPQTSCGTGARSTAAGPFIRQTSPGLARMVAQKTIFTSMKI
jgi:hypothetical protein